MSTIEKGNKLEDNFHDYLCEQQNHESLVYGVYAPQLCKIHKKKKYFCKEREADVEFDIVIELRREISSDPHLYVIFECKNHQSSIQERDVTDFSDKIGRIFGHAAKGVMVVSSRLQSGAEKVAQNRGMGIVKYDRDGLDVVAERKGGICAENGFVETQLFKDKNHIKSLKFSAYHDGSFFGSVGQFLRNVDPSLPVDNENTNNTICNSVPYISDEEIQQSTLKLLAQIGYQTGPVDLVKVCSELSLDLTNTEQTVRDVDGKRILGSANFDLKSIQVNSHDNKHRERFTIAHEIGHFHLHHDKYLRSESIVEQDLFINSETENAFNYERLEIQANILASDLLLPTQIFGTKVDEYREDLGIIDKGHGYIFVDDQPCNYTPYNDLLIELSSFFEVSKQAIEIKLKKMKLLTDHRRHRRAGF